MTMIENHSKGLPLKASEVEEGSQTIVTFEERYCEDRRIRASDFERRMLLDGVSWYLRPVMKLLLACRPSTFEGEIEYLKSLRPIQSRRQYLSEIGVIADFNQYQLPLWRSMIGLRISSRRISKLRKFLPKS